MIIYLFISLYKLGKNTKNQHKFKSVISLHCHMSTTGNFVKRKTDELCTDQNKPRVWIVQMYGVCYAIKMNLKN